MGSNNVSTWVGKTLYKSINYLTSFSFSEFLPALLVFAPSPGGEHGAGVAVPLAGTFLALASPLRGLPFLGPGPFGRRLPSSRPGRFLGRRGAGRSGRGTAFPGASGPAAPSPPTGACSRERGPGRRRSGGGRRSRCGGGTGGFSRESRGRRAAAPTAPAGAVPAAAPEPAVRDPPTPGERRVQETDGAERPALNLPSAGADTAPVPRTEKRSGARGQVCVLCRGREGRGRGTSRCAARTPTPAKNKTRRRIR